MQNKANNGDIKEKITLIGVFIWSIAAVFFLYEFFLRTFLGSLEPQIMKSLHLNAETFSMIGACYYLTYGIMQVPVGLIVDRIGVKAAMVFATSLCGISAIAFGLSPDFICGFLSRLLMGFASSFAFICLLVIARTWFPKERFGFFAGLSQFIGTLGPIIAGGPLIMFLKYEHMDWRTFITGLGLFGFVLSFLCLIFVKSKKGVKEDQLVFAERKISLKRQLKSLFGNKQAWMVAIYSALIYTSIATLGAIWGTRVLIAKGLNQVHAAGAISVLWIGYAVGCPVTGLISDLMKKRREILIFVAILATFSIFALGIIDNGSFELFYFIFFCIGFSGGGQNVGFATIVEKTSDKLSAASMGLNNGLMLLFDTVNPLIFGFLVMVTMTDRSSDAFTSQNFYMALMYIPVLTAIALFLSIFFIKETYCKPQQDLVLLSSEKE
ncbi:MAG: MFS transporter [Victivallales bacterium]|nr:MFS transporter [Victivallales bacterium]